MAASSNQQETVMDTQKFELSDTELSCEELDRVSGGIKGAVEGVCSKGEGTGGMMGGGGPMGMINQIMQMVQQPQG
jgi:hypothetical protein